MIPARSGGVPITSAKLQSNEEVPFDVCNGSARRESAARPILRNGYNGRRVTSLLKIMSGVIDRKGNDHRSSPGAAPRKKASLFRSLARSSPPRPLVRLADFENSAGGGGRFLRALRAAFHSRRRAVREDYQSPDNAFTRVFHEEKERKNKNRRRKRRFSSGAVLGEYCSREDICRN